MTLAPWQPSVDTADDQHTAFHWLCTHHYTATLSSTQTLSSQMCILLESIYKNSKSLETKSKALNRPTTILSRDVKKSRLHKAF